MLTLPSSRVSCGFLLNLRKSVAGLENDGKWPPIVLRKWGKLWKTKGWAKGCPKRLLGNAAVEQQQVSRMDPSANAGSCWIGLQLH